MLSEFTKQLQKLTRQQLAVAAALLALAGAALFGFTHLGRGSPGNSEVSSQSRKGLQRYTPTPAEWASLTIEPVSEREFRAETLPQTNTPVDKDPPTPPVAPSTA